MYQITKHKIAWNAKSNEGIFLLDRPGGVEQILVDNAAEAQFLLHKLRHESTHLYRQRNVFLASDTELDILKSVREPEPQNQEIAWHLVSKVIEPKREPILTARQAVPQKTIPSPTPTISEDNLRLIEGIGPKIEQLLQAADITTFLDLKRAKTETLKEILKEAGKRFQMHDPATWGEQAGLAAKGDWAALKAWQQELKGGKSRK